MNRKVRITSVQPLSSDFPIKVKNLEDSLKNSPCLETLRSLLQLYSVILTQQAIEYFESINDPLFSCYQEKMKNLLNRPPLFLNKTVGTTSMPTLSIGLKQLRKADLTIKIHEKNSEKVSRQISLNIYKQNLEVITKLQNRINKTNSPKAKEPKSCKARTQKKFFDDESESEIDTLKFSEIHTSQDIENKLEGVIESFLLEKISKSKEIKKKYKAEMNEIRNMKGGPIIEQLAIEMEKNMQNELNELDQYLISQRKKAIKELKECSTP